MAVAQHHAAVEAQVAGAAGGHDLKLGGQEVLFLDAVLVGKQLQGEGLHGVLLLLCLVVLVAHHQGAVADQDVERLAFNHFVGLLAHLLVRQVDEQVGNAEDGVVGILADLHVHHAAVLLGDHAVQRQRDGDPLVVFDAAVVMGVHEGKLAGFVQRVLLDVQARAVDVCAQDVHAVGQRADAQLHQDDGLVAHGRPHLVAGGKLAAGGNGGVQAFVTGGFGAADGGGGELALGLVLGDEVDVACGKLLELGQLVLIVALPRGFAFHIRSLHSGIVAR